MKRIIGVCAAAALISGALVSGAAARPVQCAGLTPTIVGTPSDDVLIGTDGDDVIQALAGNDLILGKRGRDVICGSYGNDVIKGGRGTDRLWGGKGNDTLIGGLGTDLARGGGGLADACDAEHRIGCEQSHVTELSEGRVRYFQWVGSDFDPWIENPTVAEAKWMRQHYWRMMTFSPHFDSRTAWYRNGIEYEDLYAIHLNRPVENADWILRDADGNRLYIPWGCSGGTCPQWAGDFGNPDFRASWIANMRSQLSVDYRGIWVDDVNMTWRVGDGNGDFVRPIDPRTGEPMTLTNWRRYMAEFVELIRAEFPDHDIMHNAIWYAGPATNPFIQRQMAAADYIFLERGFSDRGITGSGSFSLDSLLGFVDAVHATGAGFVAGEDPINTAAEREYSLAAWLIASAGRDAIGTSKLEWGTAQGWWDGWDLNLGAATSDRYRWKGLIRRDFTHGIALVNPPESADVTGSLGGTFETLEGNEVTSVTLGARGGAVLLLP